MTGLFITSGVAVLIGTAHVPLGSIVPTSLQRTINDVTSQVTGQPTEEQRRAEDLQKRAQRAVEEAKQKQAEMEQKAAERRAAVANKLTDDRAKRCNERQAEINRALDSRAQAATRVLGRFESIQQRLLAYVSKNSLDVSQENALLTVMNDRQSSAQAAVKTLAAADFNCADANAASPGQVVKGQVDAAKVALREYREAIKAYAQAVKETVQ
ncbi:MAG TPA: hypothetical protein VF597_02275 [Candidatus Saccharimonadales bacterium]